MQLHFTVTNQWPKQKLGPFLRRQGVSQHLLRSLKYLPEGITVDGKKAHTDRVLFPGEKVTVDLLEQKKPSALPSELSISVLYESEHVMALDKPAGLIIHPTHFHQEDTLANAYCHLMQTRGQKGIFRSLGRLDADTSGIVVCAQNPFAAVYLHRNLQKRYLALVTGCLPQGYGRIKAPLSAVSSGISQKVSPEGRESVTDYYVLDSTPAASLLLVRLHTGRTHQIRTHLAFIGHPLLGDDLYGGSRELIDRHALHCAGVCFAQPGNQDEVQFVFSSIPGDICHAAACTGNNLQGWQEKMFTIL